MAVLQARITNRQILLFLLLFVLLSYALPLAFHVKSPTLPPRDALTPLQLKEREALQLRDDIKVLEDRIAVLDAQNKLAIQAQDLAVAKSKDAETAFAFAKDQALRANDAFSAADLKEQEAKDAYRYARMTEKQAQNALALAREKETIAQLALSKARELEREASLALQNAKTQSEMAQRTLSEINFLREKLAELTTALDDHKKKDDADNAAKSRSAEELPDYSARALPNPGKPILVYDDGLVPFKMTTKIPVRLAELTVGERKTAFAETMLPLVLKANQQIQDRRDQLDDLFANGDDNGIARLQNLYRLTDFKGDKSALKQALSDRIAPIPASLAVAQAAVESGWGQSRFAKEGNALFGQWAWSADAGIKPKEASNSRAVIRSFPSIYDSVVAYMHNLNTHYAYQNLREARSELLANNERVSGLELAQYLGSYAETADKYIFTLQAMILQNRFDLFENYQLAD